MKVGSIPYFTTNSPKKQGLSLKKRGDTGFSSENTSQKTHPKTGQFSQKFIRTQNIYNLGG